MLLRRTPPILGADRRPLPGSVAELGPRTIGGVPQWVLRRGVDATQPEILLLPDGPGETLIPLAREVQGELERAFVVVNWDPRGTGLSDGAAGAGPVTVSDLVDDTVELAGELVRERSGEPIVLAGIGFGSVIGLLAAARAPERFSAYIGAAQWVEPRESDRRATAWARAEAVRVGRRSALRTLDSVDGLPDDAPERSRLLDRAFRELGALYQNPDGEHRRRPPLAGLSPYTLLDLVRRWAARARAEATVGREAHALDLPRRVSSVNVPTYFLAGRFDHRTDAELAREYLRVIDAPRKGWCWIEDAGAAVPFEDPDAFAAALAHFAHEARGPPAPRWGIAT